MKNRFGGIESPRLFQQQPMFVLPELQQVLAVIGESLLLFRVNVRNSEMVEQP
jgi:hypothetical protein